MTWRVELSAAARRELAAAPSNVQRRILHALELLREEPRPPVAIALAGSGGVLRVRVGEWRILYVVRNDVLLVLVVALGHRRDIYELWKRRRG